MHLLYKTEVQGGANWNNNFGADGVSKEGQESPGKPNQRKGQNEKFMNFAHCFVNSGVFPEESNRETPNR